jgi:putative hemolysin
MNLKDHWILVAAALAVSTGLSFLFSGMEAGALALSPLRVRQLSRAGHDRARALYAYLEKPEDFLWTILVGNTLANLVAVGLTAGMLHHWLGRWPWARLAAFLVAVFYFYIVCELLPKIVFRAFPNRLCLKFVGAFRGLHFVLQPLVALVAWLSRLMLSWTGGRRFTGKVFANRDELRFIMQESAQGLTQEERLMINRVLDLQNLTVRQVAAPLTPANSARAETPISEALARCRDRNLSHLPVWDTDGKRDRVIGVLNLAALLYAPDLDAKKSARDYLQPALYLDEQLRLEEAFRRMQTSGRRMAIALGPDQAEAGVITLEDILKAIFGEVRL